MKSSLSKMSRNSLLSATLAVVLTACGSDSDNSGDNGNQPIVTPTPVAFSDLQDSVFTPRCSICHTGGGNTLPAAMNLSTAEDSFISLVSTVSLNEPEFERVTPSNADASYLIMKLEGTQSVGSQMPLGMTPLDDETIASIRQWITSGAAQ